MDCPDLVLMFEDDELSSIYGEPLPSALYREKNNTIYLGEGVNEQNVDVVIAHELAHWVTFRALSVDERLAARGKNDSMERIAEKIACLTEIYYILDQVTAFCSVNEAQRLASLTRSERRQMLEPLSRHWWLIELLRLISDEYEKCENNASWTHLT